LGTLIIKHSDLKMSEVDSYFKQETTKNADFALEKKLIDKIESVHIANNSPFYSLIF